MASIDDRAVRQVEQLSVVLGRRSGEHVVGGDREAEPVVDHLHLFEPPPTAVRDLDPTRDVAACALATMQIQRERERRAAGAEDDELRLAPVAVVHDRLEREPAGDRVLRVPDQMAVALGDAADLAKRLRVLAELVEQVPRSHQEVELVRGDERAEGLGVFLDEGDDSPVVVGVRVQREVDAHDPGLDSKVLEPRRGTRA